MRIKEYVNHFFAHLHVPVDRTDSLWVDFTIGVNGRKQWGHPLKYNQCKSTVERDLQGILFQFSIRNQKLFRYIAVFTVDPGVNESYKWMHERLFFSIFDPPIYNSVQYPLFRQNSTQRYWWWNGMLHEINLWESEHLSALVYSTLQIGTFF